MKKTFVILIVLLLLVITVVPVSAKKEGLDRGKLVAVDTETRTITVEIVIFMNIIDVNYYVAEDATFSGRGTPSSDDLGDLPLNVSVRLEVEEGIVTHIAFIGF